MSNFAKNIINYISFFCCINNDENEEESIENEINIVENEGNLSKKNFDKNNLNEIVEDRIPYERETVEDFILI